MDITNIAPTLLAKLRALANITQDKVAMNRSVLEARPEVPRPAAATLPAKAYEIVAVGSSTGGPSCLQALLMALPKSYPYPVVIVQHMPVGFTKPLAERLDSICQVEVHEASDGDVLMAGRVAIAPAGRHLLVKREGNHLVCRLSDEPTGALHRPSADVLFASVTKAVGERAAGFLLTGMGKDGAKGLLAMRQAGCSTVAQDEKTSVVWGMPRAAVELGAAEQVLGLPAIRARLLELAEGRGNASA
jgi:two-component system chemotaxis response regulator CheB